MNDPSQVYESGYCAGFTHALKLARYAERRAPTEDDRPPLSTFPMTAAARAALRSSYGGVVPSRRAMRVRARDRAQAGVSA